MSHLEFPKLMKLTNEIHFFNEQGIMVSIEVGKRLDEAKNEFSTSDDWMEWANREFGYKKSQAYKLVAIAKRFQSTGINLAGGIEKMFALTAFDDEELETPVVLPSGEEKKPIDMSQAEIEKYKKQLKETERERVRLENESVHYRQLLNQERSKSQQVVTKEIKVEVVPSDYQDLKTQAVAGQKLNTENVQLQRTIQQMKEETTRADETSQLCKKLRESFKNLLSTVNQEHYNAKFYFDQVAGSQQTFQIVQAFQQEFNEIINTVLLDWKDRTEIKPNLRSV